MIRRMLARVGHKVRDLTRVRIDETRTTGGLAYYIAGHPPISLAALLARS